MPTLRQNQPCPVSAADEYCCGPTGGLHYSLLRVAPLKRTVLFYWILLCCDSISFLTSGVLAGQVHSLGFLSVPWTGSSVLRGLLAGAAVCSPCVRRCAGGGREWRLGSGPSPHCRPGAAPPSSQYYCRYWHWCLNCCWVGTGPHCTRIRLSSRCQKQFGWAVPALTLGWVPSAVQGPGAAGCRAPGKEVAPPHPTGRWWGEGQSRAARRGRWAGSGWTDPSGEKVGQSPHPWTAGHTWSAGKRGTAARCSQHSDDHGRDGRREINAWSVLTRLKTSPTKKTSKDYSRKKGFLIPNDLHHSPCQTQDGSATDNCSYLKM